MLPRVKRELKVERKVRKKVMPRPWDPIIVLFNQAIHIPQDGAGQTNLPATCSASWQYYRHPCRSICWGRSVQHFIKGSKFINVLYFLQ